MLAGQDGLNLNPTVVAGWTRAGVHLRSHRDSEHLPLRLHESAALPDHQRPRRHLRHHGVQPRDHVGAYRRQNGVHVLRARRLHRVGVRQSARPEADRIPPDRSESGADSLTPTPAGGTPSRPGADSLMLRPRSRRADIDLSRCCGTRQSSVLPVTEAVQDLPPTVAVLNDDPTFGLSRFEQVQGASVQRFVPPGLHRRSIDRLQRWLWRHVRGRNRFRVQRSPREPSAGGRRKCLWPAERRQRVRRLRQSEPSVPVHDRHLTGPDLRSAQLHPDSGWQCHSLPDELPAVRRPESVRHRAVPVQSVHPCRGGPAAEQHFAGRRQVFQDCNLAGFCTDVQFEDAEKLPRSPT